MVIYFMYLIDRKGWVILAYIVEIFHSQEGGKKLNKNPRIWHFCFSEAEVFFGVFFAKFILLQKNNITILQICYKAL